MGIQKRWSRINSWNLDNIPDEPGAYEIGDRYGNVIDIGSSGNLAERLPRKVMDSKFRGQAVLFRYLEDYDHEEAEAELQAEFMARNGRPPKFTYRVQGEAYDILEDLLDEGFQ